MRSFIRLLPVLLFALILFTCPSVGVARSSMQERVADIEKNYGLKISMDSHGADFAAMQMPHIESALPHLGAVFTRRVNNIRIAAATPDFHIRISDDAPSYQPRAAGMFTLTREEAVLHLFPTNSYVPDGYDVVHEFGHAAAYLSDGTVDVLAAFRELNGPYDSRFDPDRHPSAYAATSAGEDFAEVFATMVWRGGDQPYTGGDTVLYRKYRYVQEYLQEQLGSGSQAVRRSRAFRGLPAE